MLEAYLHLHSSSFRSLCASGLSSTQSTTTLVHLLHLLSDEGTPFVTYCTYAGRILVGPAYLRPVVDRRHPGDIPGFPMGTWILGVYELGHPESYH